jgi:hypothetical protein
MGWGSMGGAGSMQQRCFVHIFIVSTVVVLLLKLEVPAIVPEPQLLPVKKNQEEKQIIDVDG